MKRLLLLLGFWLFATSAMAEDDHLIHADVPLWTEDAERIWPRRLTTATSLGCAHPIELGDWELKRSDYPLMGEWIRFGNYGVLHCFIVELRGHDQEAIGRGGHKYSVLVSLGKTRGRRGEVDLWALQSGTVPGSDYLLLASMPSSGRPIREFDVLRRHCPKDRLRGGPPLDILITEYCAINSQQELIDLARQMADRPPLGRLTFRDRPKEE